MNKRFSVSGFCPTQNKNFAVSIEYLDTGIDNTYIKGMFACEYTYRNECPLSNICPIYNEAPNEITK